jgi:hypothetical protein
MVTCLHKDQAEQSGAACFISDIWKYVYELLGKTTLSNKYTFKRSMG